MTQWATFYMLPYFMSVVNINNTLNFTVVVSMWVLFSETYDLMVILVSRQRKVPCAYVTN